MADKGGKTSAAGMKPVPMKLFATWEVEKSSPNCIPRLCSLTLTRLLILKPLENDLTSVILAVKMQSSKRTLRSNEIMLSPNGMLDTEIDLSFSLQYPHFLKRDGNKLQVMLQRRKKYKNRTILGYKTLAIGQVNMAQVLQRSVDRELNLYSDPKERTNKVAQVMVLSLSSQPVDHEENGRVKLRPGEVDRSPDVDMSDDEEADDFQENWSNDELSDSEAPEEERPTRGRKSSRGPLRPTMSRVSAQHHRNLKQRFLSLLRRFRVSESSDEESTPDEYAPHGSEGPQASHLHMEELRLLEQRNIKQKFISLLRRFKVSEEVLDSEQDQELCDVEAPAPQEIADLFDDLEDLSDSGPEVDTISVLSTPKPKLRPFFTGRGSSTEILDLPRLSPVIARNGSSVGPAGVCYSGFDDFGISLQDSGRLSDESSKRHDSDSHLDNLTDQEMSDTPVSMPIPVHQSASPGLEDKYRRTPSMDSKYGRSPALEDKFARSYGYDDKLSAGASSSSSPHSPYSPRPRQAIPERSKSMLEKKRVITIERRNSAGNIDSLPRKVLLDQLSSVLSSDEALPDSFILVNTAEWQGQLLAQVLQEPHHKVICTCSSADVKATISFVVNKIQKLHHLFRHPRGSFEQTDWTRGCNSNSRDPAPLKIAMAGGDSYVNQVLRPYVEQFSAKSHDWQNYIKFLYIPLGTSSLAKYLGSVDSTYSSLFCDTLWKETFEKSENQRLSDLSDIGSRVSRYLQGTCSVVQLPIAEAMITYKEKSTEDESSQTFVPFLTEVRIGPIDVPSGPSTSVDLEETGNPPPPQGALSSSPPQSMQMDKTKENHTPPSSPNVNHPGILGSATSSGTNQATSPEFLELQLDYWTMERPTDLGPKDKLVKKDSKSSLKTTFKSVQVFRLPHATNGESMGALSMMVITKEKKQKIMRLGKKSKESESKSQLVEGISRLICTSKSQSHPLTVSIDGVDWSGVKFFQVSSQWQTHIKHIPLLLMSHVESPL